jgi:hypothetical protein
MARDFEEAEADGPPGVSRDNAALLCALLLLPERVRIRSTVPRGQ